MASVYDSPEYKSFMEKERGYTEEKKEEVVPNITSPWRTAEAVTTGSIGANPYGYGQAMSVPSTSIYGMRESGAPTTTETKSTDRTGYTPKPPTGSVQTTQTTYTGKRPEIGLPEYDTKKIKAYRQKIAGPAMRKLRSEMRRALSASYENPNVRRHILRGALEGYGIGLGSITAESERAAGQQYAQEYGMQYQKALATYQSAFQAYMSTAKQTTSQKNLYGPTTETGLATKVHRWVPGIGYTNV